MGDRFYIQRDKKEAKYFGKGKYMKTEKVKRVLKKDIITEFESLVGQEVPGLDRMTVVAIQHLHQVVINYGAKNLGD